MCIIKFIYINFSKIYTYKNHKIDTPHNAQMRI